MKTNEILAVRKKTNIKIGAFLLAGKNHNEASGDVTIKDGVMSRILAVGSRCGETVELMEVTETYIAFKIPGYKTGRHMFAGNRLWESQKGKKADKISVNKINEVLATVLSIRIDCDNYLTEPTFNCDMELMMGNKSRTLVTDVWYKIPIVEKSERKTTIINL